jgi:subtilisin family serine protease
MGQKHVILRSAGPAVAGTPGARAGAPSGVTFAPSPAVTIEVDDLAPARAVEVARSRDVVAVAPVVPMKLIAPVPLNVPADPLQAGPTWGVQAVGADTSPFTGRGVVVAVLDTGIDPRHPAFAGVALERRNFTDAGDDDQHGHGTHCAGTIFGRAVDGTRIGVATGVERAMIGKVLGGNGGGSDTIVQAIQWAIAGGANVISMSLGIDFPGFVSELTARGVPLELATSMALEGYRANVLLFERLASLIKAQNSFLQAALLVAAAGNESRREVSAEFEIAVSPPAVADGVVSVAALGRGANGLTIADFSNVGARVSGPGVGVLSAKPGGGLQSMNGTSMATPHVAGVAALWAEKLRIAGQFNGQLLADRLVGSATLDGLQAGFDPQDVGAGLVRAPQN